jgi:peptide/nickel transport system ATP-binding protein
MFASEGSVGEAVAAALDDVRLDGSYRGRYPDELSGGERQRVAIARALIAGPELLLCDEILSALDVSVQASIIELLRRLRRERDVAMLFIAHDLSVVRSLADRVGVLFAGVLMESGPVEAIFRPPFHPYTLSLLDAVPRIETGEAASKRQPTRPGNACERIAGAACAFAGRCPWQLGDICVKEPPPLRRTGDGLAIRCHIPLDDLARRAAGRRAAAPNVPQEATSATGAAE